MRCALPRLGSLPLDKYPASHPSSPAPQNPWGARRFSGQKAGDSQGSLLGLDVIQCRGSAPARSQHPCTGGLKKPQAVRGQSQRGAGPGPGRPQTLFGDSPKHRATSLLFATGSLRAFRKPPLRGLETVKEGLGMSPAEAAAAATMAGKHCATLGGQLRWESCCGGHGLAGSEQPWWRGRDAKRGVLPGALQRVAAGIVGLAASVARRWLVVAKYCEKVACRVGMMMKLGSAKHHHEASAVGHAALYYAGRSSPQRKEASILPSSPQMTELQVSCFRSKPVQGILKKL